MNIFKLLFELFVIYLVYKFIFEFIIPVYRASKHVKQKMNDMHQNQANPVNNQYNNVQSTPPPEKASHKDYIDYEEIK